MTWDLETATSAFWACRLASWLCAWAEWAGIWGSFLPHPLLPSFFALLFQRWAADQNCSINAWNWTEDFTQLWGVGGAPNRRTVSSPVFIFKNQRTQ